MLKTSFSQIFFMLNTVMHPPVYQKPTLENSVHYLAHTFSFLATGKDTDNAFSLIHCYFRKGFTPPKHYHEHEDESFYILEGEIEFNIGDERFRATAGSLVVAPKGVPHHFELVTETAKALLLISPAGFEVIFQEFGTPAETLELPPIPTNLNKELFERMHQRMSELGGFFLPQI